MICCDRLSVVVLLMVAMNDDDSPDGGGHAGADGVGGVEVNVTVTFLMRISVVSLVLVSWWWRQWWQR